MCFRHRALCYIPHLEAIDEDAQQARRGCHARRGVWSRRAAAQSPRTRVDLSKLGPQVGERVPDFSLKDAAGKEWTLQSIMGPKGAMLVFFRSADW